MDVYPRSKTWPYLTVTLLLFALALWYPNWWISWGAESVGWAQATGEPTGGLASVAVAPVEPTRPLWTDPVTAPLRPSVATRVVVVPASEASESEASESSEIRSTARLPSGPRVAAGETLPTARLADASPDARIEVGPILPPGGRRALDLTPADIEGLADSLPADVMLQDTVLQSAADSSTPLASTWPRPVSLWAMIGHLQAGSSQVATWANRVQDTLSTLQAVPTLEDPQAETLFDRMEQLAARAPALEVYLSEANRRQLRRIRYGLQRRSYVWRHLHYVARQQQATPQIVGVSAVIPILDEVERRLKSQHHDDSWHSYLMIDRLRHVGTETWVEDPNIRCAVAREVLKRMSSASLTPEQKHILEDPAIKHLKRELEDWADGPIDLLTLVTALEQFEQIRSAAIAAQVVDQMQALAYCRYPNADELYGALDMHYRNANIRFSVSEQLINDLLPVLEPEDSQVRDRILGASVVGQNRTWTDLHVSLIEDEHRLRLKLNIDGRSRARTVSTKGPVRLFTLSRSTFRADKELIVSPDGIYTRRANASANGRSTLLDLKTDYDQIPLLGWIVRQIALGEHDEHRATVRARFRQRVSQQARRQLDDSMQERLTGMEDRLNTAILQPLRDLKLDPTTMEMRSTADRLVMRYRLASRSQLGAHTPRPRGVAGNVMSFQLHESLANNLIAQLEINDERIELETLMKRLSEKLKIDRQDIHEEIPPDVVLHLGHDQPIQFEFDDERVLVTIRIKELKTRRRTWRNFVVRGRYRADVGQTHVDLHRDDGIELISEQLGFRDQVALRGIFTKVMTRNHRLNILRGRFLSDARLNQLGVTQFVARDGWIGMSIGPLDDERVAAAKK